MAIVYLTVKELIDYLLSIIEEVDSYQVTYEDLVEDSKTAAAVKYLTQTAVEACANIAEHIIFGLHLGHPETNRELFPILSKEGIINEDLADKLSNAVGLRNILVHQYRKVDLAILADSATVGLNDLREFAKAVNDFLEKQEKSNP